MPPDISASPMALAAGTPPGRASGLPAVGSPGGDPLAALFAALLAHNNGASPAAGASSSALKAALKPSALFKLGDKPAEDKTQENTLSPALPILTPLLTPIQIRPTLPPTAGVSVGRKTTEKTMDTSPVPASPAKEKAGVTPGGELPLQDVPMAASGASTLFPAFLIASPIIASPIIASPTLPVIPSAADRVMALPIIPGLSASVPSLPVGPLDLPSVAPVASPRVFVLGAVAVSIQPPSGNVLRSAAMAPIVTPGSAPSQPASADYVPQSRGFPVPVDAVLKLTTLPPGETVAANSSVVTPPIPASVAAEGAGQALPNTAQVLVPMLPQTMLAVAVQTATTGKPQQGLLPAAKAEAPSTGKAPFAAPLLAATAANEFIVTDGKTATVGAIATDVKATTDGRTATDGKIAMDGRVATDGKTLTAGGTPEKGLKSAALPADTLTRSQAVPAKTLPTELRLQVIGKRSERRAESAGSDALPAIPAAAPAQAEAARTEAKPLTPADRAEMIRQVAEGASAMPLPAKPGASEQMTLQLHPRDWGQLQVSVRITPGSQPNAVQTVTAHIVAQNPQVKAALENGSGDLRQTLREAGLHLDRISVTVQRMDASAQAGTATSGGRHEANHGGASQGMGGAFGETTPNQKTGMSNGTGMSGVSGNGMPSFAASGGSHGGRQGGQPPPAHAAAYAPAEPEDAFPLEVPRRLATGQVDMRA